MMAIVALLVWEIRTNYSALDREVSERRTVQRNLEELTRSLESRVAERTGKLSEANQALQDDIAKRKMAEASLAAANQKLSLLSQITRHDISNRIFALLVDIHLAREYATDITFRKSLDKMEMTSMAIVDQINFTKDYQEIGAKAPSWYPVAPMIRHAAEQLDTGGIAIEIQLRDMEIFADGMIRKVFYNLIDNAIRHGGRVTRIGFSSQEIPDGLVIVCEDNGTGIPASDKEQIFSKGFGRGSGLGLFLIREILSITGITIRECGEYGQGARFEMLVPKGDYRPIP
jgi:signal transduction histidine kinase